MHIIQTTRIKKTLSLRASVERTHRRTEPLQDRCFDFTDGFKRSELSHFAL